MTLPPNAGTSTYVLQTDGIGNTSWVPPTSGSAGLTLGTSAGATNPQRTGQIGTGLFSATSNTVSIADNSTDVMDIGTQGPDILGTITQGSYSIGYQINGVNALWQDNTNYNTAVGDTALPTTVSQLGGGFNGSRNVAVGFQALNANTAGSENTAIGAFTLISNTTGVANTAIGPYALITNTAGNYNTAVGSNALKLNTTGQYNTAIGPAALFSNTTGVSNTAVGYNALYTNLTAVNNTVLGYQAGYDVTTGGHNVIIGDYAATGVGITTGSNNILIGQNLQELTNTSSNQLDIGNLIFATGLSSGSTMSTGKVGIGTTAPANPLDVNGAMVVGTYAGTAGPSNGLAVSGGITIGTTALTSGTILDMGSNTNSMLLPSGTSAQRPSGTNGMIRFNNTVPQVEAYYSGAWNALGGGGVGTITLGTSAAATNPQRSSEAGTGFYSAADQTVAVTANSIEAMQWNTLTSGTDYLSITPGASGSSTAIGLAAAGSTNAALTVSTAGSGNITLTPGTTGDIVISNNAIDLFQLTGTPSQTIAAGNNGSYYNFANTYTPTLTLNGSTHAPTRPFFSAANNTANLSNVTVSGGDSTNLEYLYQFYGARDTITGTPTLNTSNKTREFFYGIYASTAITPALTAVGGSTVISDSAGYFSNSASSAGNANLIYSSQGIYVQNLANLGTTGTTSAYGAYISNIATASTTYGAYVAGSSTSTNTTNYGLYVDQAFGGGTATTYGIMLDNPSGSAGSTDYSLYVADLAPSYFAGKVGIGTTAPANPLDVNGAMVVGTYAGTAGPSNGLAVSGGITIGTTALTSGTILDMGSNNSSMLLPSGTSVQRPSGTNGMIRYNNTTGNAEGYVNGAWTTFVPQPNLSGAQMWYPMLSPSPPLENVTQNQTYAANTAYYVQLSTPVAMTVTSVSPAVTTGASGAYGVIAFYNSSCSKISGSDANFSAASGSYPVATLGSTITIPAGIFYYGWAVTNASVALISSGGGIAGYEGQWYFYTGFGGLGFTGSNAPSGSGSSFAMPSSCGTKSTQWNYNAPLALVLQ